MKLDFWGNIIHQGQNKIEKFDWILIFAYCTLSIFLLIIISNSSTKSSYNSIILGFGILTTLYLYVFYFKKLRIFKLFLIWFLIGIIQFGIYLRYKHLEEFASAIGGTYLNSLTSLIIMLVVLKSFDIIYRLIYKEHLIITGNHVYGEGVDGRSIRILDIVFSMIGVMIVIIVSSMIF